VVGFGKMIPNLSWDIQEVISNADSSKIIVRSVASGKPGNSDYAHS